MANSLYNLLNKKTKLVIGLLSGTSVDGIDAVLTKISGSGIKTKIEILDYRTYRIPEKVRTKILKNSVNDTAKINEICRLNVILGKLFADSAKKLCRVNRISTDNIDLIGSHGQTIHHLPNRENYLGYKIKSTLQIGDPSVISNLAGITTVGDFRIADCAAEGDGAPLVPYLDYVLFRSSKINRALLNIGGISNITFLKSGCDRNEVTAFDTGPGNMLIDGLTKRLFGKNFDRDGKIASSGELDEKLFSALLEEPYYKMKHPKSTGRERYGAEFQEAVLYLAKNTEHRDIIRTVTEYTAFTIWYNYKKFLKPKAKLDELIVSGGGAHNKFLMKLIGAYFGNIKIKEMNYRGINADNKEAVLFAVLANECINGLPANMMTVTGSEKDAILGKICPAVN